MQHDVSPAIAATTRYLACFGAAALLAAAPGVQAKDYNYATYLPPQHPTTKALNTFLDDVRKATNGAVSFTMHDSGTLATGKSTITAIKNGLTDGGAMMTIYNPTEVPANAFLNEMNFHVDDARVGAAASTEMILNDCKQCLDEFRKYNVHYLGSYSTTPYKSMCKSDFSSGVDFTGMRVRVPGSEQGTWIKEVGGIPVNMENSEAYQAMQRNQLDCVLGPIAWMKVLSLGELTGAVVDIPTGSYFAGSLFNFNEREYKKLPKEHRQALVDATANGIANAVYNYIDEDNEVARSARERGVKFLEPTADLVAKRTAFLEGQKARLLEKAKGKVKDPEVLFEKMLANLERWRGLIAGKDLTREQYAELLRTEIFSKIEP